MILKRVQPMTLLFTVMVTHENERDAGGTGVSFVRQLAVAS